MYLEASEYCRLKGEVIGFSVMECQLNGYLDGHSRSFYKFLHFPRVSDESLECVMHNCKISIGNEPIPLASAIGNFLLSDLFQIQKSVTFFIGQLNFQLRAVLFPLAKGFTNHINEPCKNDIETPETHSVRFLVSIQGYWANLLPV